MNWRAILCVLFHAPSWKEDRQGFPGARYSGLMHTGLTICGRCGLVVAINEVVHASYERSAAQVAAMHGVKWQPWPVRRWHDIMEGDGS